jgi:rare lipoprotein A (peptidoglycan hydrolase)
VVFPPHESRPAARFDEAELDRLAELEARARRRAVEPRRPRTRHETAYWIVASILVILASFMVAALMVSTIPRSESESAVREALALTEASSGMTAVLPGRLDVLQTVDASPPPAPTAATGAASEGALGTPTTPMSAPEEARRLRGTATWYCSGPSTCTRGYSPSDLVGAIDPTLGIARGSRVTVSSGSRSIVVRVVDVCACKGARLIDLTVGAFSRLASPSRGVIPITLSVGSAIVPTLPPTDTR